MSTKTTNYGLTKPALSDPADITAINANWDIIDSKIKEYAHENVPNVATNDQTPTYSDTTTLATLKSGEKLNVAFQKIKYAITQLINHINTHKVITYVSLSEIGLSGGSETIEAIAENMANNSELNLEVGVTNANIYPQTYGVLKVIKKNSSRVVFKFYNKAIAYEYVGIYDGTTTSKWSGWKYLLTTNDVINDLTSAATDKALSANKGRELADTLSNKVNGGAIDLSSYSLTEIVEFVSSQPGRAYIGRFRLGSTNSPTNSTTWFRGMLTCQNPSNASNDVSVNILAMSGDNIAYLGNIYGYNTFTITWQTTLRKSDVVNNLTSTNTDNPLSAAQGKVLNDSLKKETNITSLGSFNSAETKVLDIDMSSKENGVYLVYNINVTTTYRATKSQCAIICKSDGYLSILQNTQKPDKQEIEFASISDMKISITNFYAQPYKYYMKKL